MQEEWRDIAGYEGLYQVSNYGRVKNAKTGRIMKPKNNGRGYLCLSLHINGKRKFYNIHRLVANAFIPNIENKPEIDHIDCDQSNNRTDNLRWVTRLENMRNPITVKNRPRGESSTQSIPIICIETGTLFFGSREAERKTGIAHQHISDAVKGKLKKVGGYHWRYATPEEAAK